MIRNIICILAIASLDLCADQPALRAIDEYIGALDRGEPYYMGELDYLIQLRQSIEKDGAVLFGDMDQFDPKLIEFNQSLGYILGNINEMPKYHCNPAFIYWAPLGEAESNERYRQRYCELAYAWLLAVVNDPKCLEYPNNPMAVTVVVGMSVDPTFRSIIDLRYFSAVNALKAIAEKPEFEVMLNAAIKPGKFSIETMDSQVERVKMYFENLSHDASLVMASKPQWLLDFYRQGIIDTMRYIKSLPSNNSGRAAVLNDYGLFEAYSKKFNYLDKRDDSLIDLVTLIADAFNLNSKISVRV